MKQKIILLFLCYCRASFSFVKLKETKVLSSKLSVLLPESFRLMNGQEVKSKYPTGNPPTEVYTSNDLSVNVGFNYTSNKLQEDQISEAFPQIVKQFEILYPLAKWYKREIVKIDGKDFIFMEMVVGSLSSSYYNLMSLTSMNGRVLISSFNCPASKQSEWKKDAHVIIKSIHSL
jgi:hypothetical protein